MGRREGEREKGREKGEGERREVRKEGAEERRWREEEANHTPCLLYMNFVYQVTEYVEEVFAPDNCFLFIKLDLTRIKLLKVMNLFNMSNKS